MERVFKERRNGVRTRLTISVAGLVLALATGVGASGAKVVTAHPLASEDVLEPSLANEVEHALSLVPTNAVPPSAACADFARLYATNGMSATERAISLVSAQKDGSWHWRGTNVTPVAVELLRRMTP